MFFQKISKIDGFNMFLALISPTFDDSSDSPGQKKTLGPARFYFVSFWRPRWPWWPRGSAIAVLVTSSSGVALIVTFLAIKSFVLPLFLFWQEIL
jgi:hypothetical protein